jgi:hypothetical protein
MWNVAFDFVATGLVQALIFHFIFHFISPHCLGAGRLGERLGCCSSQASGSCQEQLAQGVALRFRRFRSLRWITTAIHIRASAKWSSRMVVTSMNVMPMTPTIVH